VVCPIGLAEPVPKPISTLATSVRIIRASARRSRASRARLRSLSITRLGTVQASSGPRSRESRRRRADDDGASRAMCGWSAVRVSLGARRRNHPAPGAAVMAHLPASCAGHPALSASCRPGPRTWWQRKAGSSAATSVCDTEAHHPSSGRRCRAPGGRSSRSSPGSARPARRAGTRGEVGIEGALAGQEADLGPLPWVITRRGRRRAAPVPGCHVDMALLDLCQWHLPRSSRRCRRRRRQQAPQSPMVATMAALMV